MRDRCNLPAFFGTVGHAQLDLGWVTNPLPRLAAVVEVAAVAIHVAVLPAQFAAFMARG
jgi:hypothetical protein